MNAYMGVDSVGLFLSGGSSNYNPSDSLGGEISSKQIKGLIPIYNVPVQGLIIEQVTPENLEGSASISILNDAATYTPPNGTAGTAVAIAAGQRKLLAGGDTSKAIRIYRESGKTFQGTAEFELVDMLNGVISMSNVPDADRQAGSTYYRALFLKGLSSVKNIQVWITTDGQASFAMAKETPESDDTIQDISDESVAPVGLSWVNAVDESSALNIGSLATDDIMGLWIRRTFPAAGIVAAKEQVDFHLSYSKKSI